VGLRSSIGILCSLVLEGEQIGLVLGSRAAAILHMERDYLFLLETVTPSVESVMYDMYIGAMTYIRGIRHIKQIGCIVGHHPVGWVAVRCLAEAEGDT
jgi:hypothetical protein